MIPMTRTIAIALAWCIESVGGEAEVVNDGKVNDRPFGRGTPPVLGAWGRVVGSLLVRSARFLAIARLARTSRSE